MLYFVLKYKLEMIFMASGKKKLKHILFCFIIILAIITKIIINVEKINFTFPCLRTSELEMSVYGFQFSQ